MKHTSTWFLFRGAKTIPLEDIKTRLYAAGLCLHSTNTPSSDEHGIICFSEFDDGVLQAIRDFACYSRGHVLGLATTDLPSDAIWLLLDAGASEVLVWNDGANAGQVQEKIERWITVDELACAATRQTGLIGHSLCWRTLVRNIVEAARFSRTPILLTGESGTGKELLARLAHSMNFHGDGRRGDHVPDLVTLDCSTIVPELSGSELFGHERGAFTGAVSARDGAFALASGGTLFLDEIGELPLQLQTQLLRAVQEGTYKRVGGNLWQTSNFRLVCATNRRLTDLVEQGRFRLDLYYRIAGWVFATPPLRERREDILPLARHFLNAERKQGPLLDFDKTVQEYLLHRDYPGNVRELRQLVQRIAQLHVGSGPASVGDIPEGDRPSPEMLHQGWPDEQFEKVIASAVALGTNLRQITKVTSETAIRIAVQWEQGNLQRAARRLGVTDRALQLRRASGNPYNGKRAS